MHETAVAVVVDGVMWVPMLMQMQVPMMDIGGNLEMHVFEKFVKQQQQHLRTRAKWDQEGASASILSLSILQTREHKK